MTRKYYSSRNKSNPLSIEGLYWKFQHLYLYYEDEDYFKEKTGIDKNGHITDKIKHNAVISIGFQPFRIPEWEKSAITDDNIFDIIEFLYDHVSKPGEWIDMTDNGYNYSDYDSYDKKTGQKEYRDKVNSILCDYKDGYELSTSGMILSIGKDGLSEILHAEIEPYDYHNVDRKVADAIQKWRNRRLSLSERKQAIREMADVFEWLKKTKKLSDVLCKKDESALFEIANKFSIRHHDPDQKKDYDENIWYSWIFHFYLATYHAVVRLLKKSENKNKVQQINSGGGKKRRT